MNRRTALKIGAGLGLAAAGGYRFLPPSPSSELDSVNALALTLYASLDEEQRVDACVPYDHPLRQYHNRGVWGGGRDILFGFSRAQRKMLTDLMYAGLSEEGRARIPEEYFSRWSGVHSMRVLICGDPASPLYQILLTGAHINLRIGGKSFEGAAFGGPQVYGDQRGNERPGLPGNLYRDQFLLGQRILRGLDASQRKLAVLGEEPVQTSIELQGIAGSFPGIAVSELQPDDRTLAHQLVDRIFSTYPKDDVAYAKACVEANGGVDRMCLSYYEHGSSGDISEGQVFRLEGPGAVLHFRGFPHVHAFINVAMRPYAPLSSGEVLGENPVWLERRAVKELFEAAMRAETGADLAYYPEGSVAGRLRPGTIRSGDIYSLESWQENVVITEVMGSDLSAAMVAQIPSPERGPDPSKAYTVATSSYAASDLRDELGFIGAGKPGPMIRDLTAAYLKQHGFPPARS